MAVHFKQSIGKQSKLMVRGPSFGICVSALDLARTDLGQCGFVCGVVCLCVCVFFVLSGLGLELSSFEKYGGDLSLVVNAI